MMRAYTLLILATLFWGAGFIGTRWTFEGFSALWAHALRFLFAGILVAPVLMFRKRKVNILEAFVASAILFIGLLIQTIGLKYTTVAKSGFFTTFYVIFIPLILKFSQGKKFSPVFWFCLLLSLLSMLLLCDLEVKNFNYGDFLTVGSALLFAAHILYIDSLAKKIDAFSFNGLQCIFMGLLGVITALIFEGGVDLSPLSLDSVSANPKIIAGFFLVSFLSSIVAFSFQIMSQREIPPHVAGVIALLESPFAALFGFLFFSETLSFMGMMGAGLLFLSMGILILKN